MQLYFQSYSTSMCSYKKIILMRTKAALTQLKLLLQTYSKGKCLNS